MRSSVFIVILHLFPVNLQHHLFLLLFKENWENSEITEFSQFILTFSGIHVDASPLLRRNAYRTGGYSAMYSSSSSAAL